MAIPTSIEWLARHGGELRPMSDRSVLVLLNGSPHYKIVVAPAKGKSSCAVIKTESGQRIDRGLEYADADAALSGGLEELRQSLGW